MGEAGGVHGWFVVREGHEVDDVTIDVLVLVLG